MATAAGLERRTLLRRFGECDGMSRSIIVGRPHCASARAPGGRGHLAEADRQSLGYKDVASFATVYFASRRLGPGPTAEGLPQRISPVDFQQRRSRNEAP